MTILKFHCVNRRCSKHYKVVESNMSLSEYRRTTGRHISCVGCGTILRLIAMKENSNEERT